MGASLLALAKSMVLLRCDFFLNLGIEMPENYCLNKNI